MLLQDPGRFEVPVDIESDVVLLCDPSLAKKSDCPRREGAYRTNTSDSIDESKAAKSGQGLLRNSPVDLLDDTFRTLSTSSTVVVDRSLSEASLGGTTPCTVKHTMGTQSSSIHVNMWDIDESTHSDISVDGLSERDIFEIIEEFDAEIRVTLSKIKIVGGNSHVHHDMGFEVPMAPHREDANNPMANTFSPQYHGKQPADRTVTSHVLPRTTSFDLTGTIAQFNKSASKEPKRRNSMNASESLALVSKHFTRRESYSDSVSKDSLVMIPK